MREFEFRRSLHYENTAFFGDEYSPFIDWMYPLEVTESASIYMY